MPKLIDLSQKRFGKLVAMKRVGTDQSKRPLQGGHGMSEYKRLTTDKPINTDQTFLNYAFAKDSRVVLIYANGEEEKDLCEYISEIAKERGMSCAPSAEEIMDGGCLSCDCELAILYVVATQAAELRGRLKIIEDKIENADVVEVRHGHWITRDVRGLEIEVKCSICGSKDYYPAEYPNIRYPDYCGDCGAKMDGERSENGK